MVTIKLYITCCILNASACKRRWNGTGKTQKKCKLTCLIRNNTCRLDFLSLINRLCIKVYDFKPKTQLKYEGSGMILVIYVLDSVSICLKIYTYTWEIEQCFIQILYNFISLKPIKRKTYKNFWLALYFYHPSSHSIRKTSKEFSA